ncbi:hypothetical protein FQA39_LY14931 [Lamprigera yunnana]|nr:hypothetical protein FQA39_LY14931 [Lamprigera yunnana]
MYHKKLKSLLNLSKDEINQFLNSFDTVLTDCDGVLWLDNNVINNADLVMNRFRESGKRVFYVTNNSSKTREEYAKKCKKLNFKCVKEEIVSSAYLAANYLKSQEFNKKVYVVGSSGITQELEFVGIKHLGIGPDFHKTSVPVLVETLNLDPEVGAVVVGFDEHISFLKILKAGSYLRNPDCLFVATNTDEQFPLESDFIIPGTGTMVAAVQTCAGRKPVVVGKPFTYICDALIKNYNIDPKRTLMIGDRCNTDILLGTKCGFQTLLVLSGVTKLTEVTNWKNASKPEEEELIPDVYLNSLGELLPYLN